MPLEIEIHATIERSPDISEECMTLTSKVPGRQLRSDLRS
jgi:hypothetical protein